MTSRICIQNNDEDELKEEEYTLNSGVTLLHLALEDFGKNSTSTCSLHCFVAMLTLIGSFMSPVFSGAQFHGPALAIITLF